jgi:hypothetical protein
VTSKIRGVKLAPNSPFSLSASAYLRTLPNTRKPLSRSNFAVAQPMPVDAPVMTTDFMMLASPLARPYVSTAREGRKCGTCG